MRDAAIDTHRQSGRRASGAPSLDGLLGEDVASRAPKPASRKREGITSAAIAARRLGGGAAGLGRGGPSPGPIARLGARLPRVRPFKALTIAAFSVALVGIVANAMVFQRGRHPAPLFGLGQSVDGQPDAQRAAAALPPPPAPAPVERTGTIPAPVPAADPAPAPVAAPKPGPHVAAKPRHEDVSAARPKASGDKTAADHAHPRPGHTAAKPAAKVEPRADPVEKLLAEPAHKAKPVKGTEAKPVEAKAVEKPAGDHRAKAEAAAHPRHRLAAAPAPAHAAGTAAKPE